MNDQGTHIRAFLEHLEGQPEITRLVIYVYPLKPQDAADLGEVIHQATAKFLTERGLSDGNERIVPIGTGH